MENFNPDQRYATDFNDLAFYTKQHDRLMAHWREVLPLRMLDISYEDTVADFDDRAQALVDFLGVEWDERCLAFHQHARCPDTQPLAGSPPLYNSSVERWKAYAPYLPALDRAFEGV